MVTGCWCALHFAGHVFHFIMPMIVGKARKRKWKEKKLMKEYAKVHKKDEEDTNNLPAAAESVKASLYQCLLLFGSYYIELCHCL